MRRQARWRGQLIAQTIQPGWASTLATRKSRDAWTSCRDRPTSRLTTMDDIVGATVFLLENPAMNGVNLKVDGGLHCM